MRPMEKSDVAQVTSLLNAYLAKFEVAPIFSEADVAHWFLPTDGVVNSYVTLVRRKFGVLERVEVWLCHFSLSNNSTQIFQ